MFDNFKKLHTIGFRAAKRNNDIIYVGFVLVCILAVLGLVLQLKRGFDGMDPTWTFSTGIEVIGIFICAIIYYSCMNGDNHSDDKLIVFISIGFGQSERNDLYLSDPVSAFPDAAVHDRICLHAVRI